MSVPELTNEQRVEFLRKAAQQRVKRAAFRDDLKEGKVTLAEALDRSDDPVVGRLHVRLLVESLPRCGKAKAAKIMDEIGISESRRVQGLGVRQREKLLEMLG
ncbi:MAG: integration host factor [Coriobacteriia bacterium]|nr:integration host factor [Coriobacteriia bacterium]